ncbi:4'-phosphopantetheinyl transferase EntD (siderophore biosynthesis) [Streptomyces sp. Termitarium-T10T-6]|nr:4'-phosphopantetheinyl transferase EntD (siderophore biosynthesis) [Streptomyces sp. Termitarium-T10T-6]
MIDEIVPVGAASAECFGDVPEATLYPEERAALGKAGEARRLEFTTVRHCARRALGRLGLPPTPLLPGMRGAPRWPDGVAGSMTHCAGYRAAAVAHCSDVRALGIDAEPHEPLAEGLLDYIAVPDERGPVSRLVTQHPEVHWDRLLFCAKEAVYKAWFPVTQRWLSFHDAEVSLSPDGSFRARILAAPPAGQPVPPGGFEGRWLARNGFLLACATDPRPV